MTSEGPIRISAKNLGRLALPSHCPRCFWLQLKMGFRLPFQIFPGIFSSLDSYQKRCVHRFYEQHREFPPWMSALGGLSHPVAVPHHSRFWILDDDSRVQLTGTPDDIFLRTDGDLVIVDYKTARHSKTQDGLRPMYDVQLNCYAIIAERLAMGRVSALALVYFEPVTELEDVDSKMSDAGFDLDFSAHVVPVALNPSQIPLLLHRARETFDSPEPAPSPHCKDCHLLGQILALGTP